ncbi:MAG TPA: hypothetical protein VJ951_16240 [Bacteroidales bacterium]|nr:hypothetical protein [Bacteroidales bacterium]
MPVFKEWNTLLTGNRITGISVGKKLFDIGEGPYMRKNVQRTGILYIQDDMSHLVYAPDNLTLAPGKEIPLIINKKDPDYYLIATIPGFYLQFNRAVKLVIVLIIWGAIFSTLIQIQKGNLTVKP